LTFEYPLSTAVWNTTSDTIFELQLTGGQMYDDLVIEPTIRVPVRPTTERGPGEESSDGGGAASDGGMLNRS
jgi:hypothetical protein